MIPKSGSRFSDKIMPWIVKELISSFCSAAA
jgi:hypothetical protein